MHPYTKPVTVVLILCMVILGVLLLPLPLIAYKILKFFLSLGLLYAAGFFLRDSKKLMFKTSEGQIESGTLDPVDGSFSGTLRNPYTDAPVEDLTEENSQIIQYLENTNAPLIPCISINMSFGLVLAALILNPMIPLHLPRNFWMLLDVLIIALLGFAWHLIRAENAGNRRFSSITQTVNQSRQEYGSDDLDPYPYWPATLGVLFVIALLGTQVDGGQLKDIDVRGFFSMIVAVLFLTVFIYFSISVIFMWSGAFASIGYGFGLVLALLIYVWVTFCGGIFASKSVLHLPPQDRRNTIEAGLPDDYE